MAFINYADKKINCKIVYYGPGESGKTTNLAYINNQLDPSVRSKIACFEEEGGKTLFFDSLTLDLGKVKNFDTTYSIYSAPGQYEYKASRKILLEGVDGIIFVVDSQKEKLKENQENFSDLEENLDNIGISVEKIPVILQYNKRDLHNILTIDDLEKELNPRGLPYIEAVAQEGNGVFASLKCISNLILTGLQ